ncbi:MAG: hypothetical protein DRI34_02065 [Deltaproteobacteria bacterium]|nr:MAG: hypothetical protein DRI34_02065 [Deltaproteobacteria bacterium]
MCPRCRTSRPAQQKLSITGWAFAGGAVLFLAALGMWAARLDRGTRENQAAATVEPVADGTLQPGPPLPVTFGREHCRSWFVSGSGERPRKLPPLLLLTSRVADPYGLVAAGFTSECGPQPVLVLEDLQPGTLAEAGEKARLAVAVGTAAVQLLRRQLPALPLFYAAVPDPQEKGLDGEKLAGVSPWIPAAPMVRHWLAVLPRGAVALFHSSGALDELAGAVKRQLHRAGREVIDVALPAGADIAGLSGDLDGKAKSWAVLVDRRIVDDETFNRLQVAAEEKKIPLAVSDEEHVRNGALVGVGADSHRIGRQLCRLAAAWQAGRLPAGSHVFCPEYSFAVVHQAVAEKLGYLIDFSKVAQVKVYRWH